MKHSAIFFTLIIVGFLSCEDEKSPEINPAIVGNWKLIQIQTDDGEIFQDPNDGYPIELQLLIEGKITGSSGYNTVFGDFETTSQNLIITRLGGSEVGLTDWAGIFDHTLRKTYSNGEYLLFYDLEEQILRLSSKNNIELTFNLISK